jgi:hypothetical protein
MLPQLNEIESRAMAALPTRRSVVVALVHIPKATGFQFRVVHSRTLPTLFGEHPWDNSYSIHAWQTLYAASSSSRPFSRNASLYCSRRNFPNASDNPRITFEGLMCMTDLTISALTAFPDRLAECFAMFPTAAHNWRPNSWDGIPSERLTAIEQICHVRDIETDGYHVRIARILTENEPVLKDIAGEPLAVDRQYFLADPQRVLADFRIVRVKTIESISGLSEEQWQRIGIFEGTPTSLRGLMHFLCSHDNQHLAGLHWLRGKMHASN